MEWSFRLRALLHLEYLCGLEGYGSRENAIGAVEGAFGLEGETLLDWTKKGKHPTQILRRNFEFHQARARKEGERIHFKREHGKPASESDEFGGSALEEDGRAYQEWRESRKSR